MINQTFQNCCHEARAALESSPIFELRNLSVRYHDKAILLSGRVSSFYHKQLAQEAVRAITLETELINEIDVQFKKPK